MPQQCPAGHTVSFPVDFSSFVPSYAATPVESLNLKFDWDNGTDIPEFSQEASVQSGELYHSSRNKTKVKYGDVDYFLASIQITSPTHKNWLSLTNALAGSNEEDIILTFVREPINGTSQYIILVSPIIRVAVPIVSSPFLTSLANETRKNISLDTLFPNISINKYAYYTTCTNGFTANSNFQTAMVILNTAGILVWANFMDTIKSKFQRQHGNIAYPAYIPIYYQLFSEPPTKIISQTRFNEIVKISNGYASPVARSTVKDEVTDSYKCVPLNPETDINNGALTIDRETGTPLTNALGQRQAEIDSYNASYTASVPYDILKQYTTWFLAVAFGLIGIVIFIYFILWLGGGGESELGTGATGLKMGIAWLFKVPIYVLIAFFCLFTGLFFGIAIAWNNGTPSSPVIQKVLVPGPTPLSSPSGSPLGSPSR